MRCISLVGMPGCGKSTIGVLLAKRLGFSFLDTDIVIQTREKTKLRNLIRRHGLDGFCRIESRHILSLDCRETIIATGGSVVYVAAAMAHLKALGQVVFLDIHPEVLAGRLGDLGARGVVMKPGQSLADLHRERISLYRQYADATIRCHEKSPDELVGEIVVRLSENG